MIDDFLVLKKTLKHLYFFQQFIPVWTRQSISHVSMGQTSCVFKKKMYGILSSVGIGEGLRMLSTRNSIFWLSTIEYLGASLLSAYFPGGTVVKTLPADAWQTGDKGSILGQEDALEKGMAIHSSILTWKILQTEKTGGLQSMGSKRVPQLSKRACTHSYLHEFSLFLKVLFRSAKRTNFLIKDFWMFSWFTPVAPMKETSSS